MCALFQFSPVCLVQVKSASSLAIIKGHKDLKVYGVVASANNNKANNILLYNSKYLHAASVHEIRKNFLHMRFKWISSDVELSKWSLRT